MAAQQGNANAQYDLGMLYASDQTGASDPVLAYMLFELAAVGGNKPSNEARQRLAAALTAAQISQARELARQWNVGAPLPTAGKTGGCAGCGADG
jgi:TPR repeat protein